MRRAEAGGPSSTSLRIDNALIFDGVSDDLREGALLIERGRIAEVGDVARSADRVIDVAGGTVVPGLIDAHFHAYGISLDLLELEASAASYVALAAAPRLSAALRRGFTTVRDVAGGDSGLALALEQGLIRGPRYFYTGRALSQTGGHGDPRPRDASLCVRGGHMAEVVDGVDNLRRAVRERFRTGAHAIKIMTSGGVVSPTDPIRLPQYSAEEVRTVVEEAGRRGSYVAAHAYSPEAIVHSVSNGVRTIEHGNLLDTQTATTMREHDAYLVPTLVAYDAMERRGADLGMNDFARQKNREVLEAGQRAVETARAAGVDIGFGSDLMGPLEDEQLIGLRLQIEVDGVVNALRSATSVNAAILGRDDLGTVRVGSQADLLVLPGNPLEDPTVLWSSRVQRMVIRGGDVV